MVLSRPYNLLFALIMSLIATSLLTRPAEGAVHLEGDAGEALKQATAEGHGHVHLQPAYDSSHEVGGFTFVEGAEAQGAVCLDGTPPAYHFRAGFGSGVDNWLLDFEGGGWCNDMESCISRSVTRLGSSILMERVMNFTGILSNISQENPDFYNWNMARLRYCDGASFAGESENKTAGLKFRGRRIYRAVVEDLMSKGMRQAHRVLFSGGSAGGVAVILLCDDFSTLFPRTTTVKCFSDAGLFVDTPDVSGGRSMRRRVEGVVHLQGVQNILPSNCISRLGPVSCFFPQHLVNYVTTPLFILNAAYDWIQVQAGIAPNQSDPIGLWNNGCKLNFSRCSASQMQVLQEFRSLMINSVEEFGKKSQHGLFINSCFVHDQAYKQIVWLSDKGPSIDHKGIARSVGDWYFDRSKVKKIGCPYPCEKTCINDFPPNSQF